MGKGGLWKQGGVKKGGVGWVVGQAGRQAGRWAGGGADVSRAEDELHAKTQSHRCLRYSLEQEGGGKENRNIIKFEEILTHSPAGHHTVTRLCSDSQQCRAHKFKFKKHPNTVFQMFLPSEGQKNSV